MPLTSKKASQWGRYAVFCCALQVLPLPVCFSLPHLLPSFKWGQWHSRADLQIASPSSGAPFAETPRLPQCLLASLSITKSQSLLKLMSIELMMSSNHLILCRPLLLVSSIFLSIRVFSTESVLCIRWPKYWSFSISPSSEYSGLISLGLTGLISLLSKKLSSLL